MRFKRSLQKCCKMTQGLAAAAPGSATVTRVLFVAVLLCSRLKLREAGHAQAPRQPDAGWELSWR